MRTALLVLCSCASLAAQAAPRPNVLWITIEDLSPRLGAYGHPGARTPNLDELAARGIVYENAFASSPVCAPARACLITGMYPSAIGAQYMRCRGTLPEGTTFFTKILRDAGYWCSNNSKEDYNLEKPAGAWDRSDGKAHWRGRKEGQPFFSVFNLTITHESRIRAPQKRFANLTRALTDADRHDPAKVRVPAYYPDTPKVRRDLARLDDLTTAMDLRVGRILADLKKDGLDDDTIVFFFSDHGDGLPRGKRWLYDAGLRVPFIARYPERFAHLAPGEPGTRTERLVSFVDMGATVLSLVGLTPPAWMHGRAFAGPAAAAPRKYVHATRDRMDERTDVSRAVSDGRWKYICNYTPRVPWAQNLDYAEQMPTQRELRRLAKANKLTAEAARFISSTKPFEELYDTHADRDEVVNLATKPEHAARLSEMRDAHRRWVVRTGDLGLLNETTVRREGADRAFDPDRMLKVVAQAAAARTVDDLTSILADDDPTVRAWGARALSRLTENSPAFVTALRRAAKDADPEVFIHAARRLARAGDRKSLDRLVEALDDRDPRVRRLAADALDLLDEHAAPAAESITLHTKDSDRYVARICQKAVKDLNRRGRPDR